MTTGARKIASPLARTAAAFVALVIVPVVVEAQTGTIAEIRVHGNHTTPSADIVSLSGLSVGAAAAEPELQEAEAALRASRRFESVEVRRRYRSIENPAEILIIILVDERPDVSEGDLTPGVFDRIQSAAQLFPIVGYEDGYGVTYGARASFADVFGGSRVSVPLTWGARRQASLEVERTFERGALSLVRGAVSVNRHVNPHFDASDMRQEARVDVEKALLPWLRAGAGARVAHVDFGGTYGARHAAGGLFATVDTRTDPSFPRNAVHARLGWERVGFETGSAGKWLADARAYIGVGGPLVVALRAQVSRSTAVLPAAEQPLLGGIESLRGYRAGHAAGDSMAAGSAELRLPINSPLSVGRFGLKAFVDTGAVWNAGTSVADQRFERGIGGGIYFGAGAFLMDVTVAWPRNGKPRGHVGLGVGL